MSPDKRAATIATPLGERILSPDLFNRGVGPAHQQSLRAKVDDRYVKNANELYEVEPCAAAPRSRWRAAVRALAAKDAGNAVYRDQLQASQGRGNVEFCYCSVFPDCRKVLRKWQDPQPVEACARDEATEFVS